MIGRLVWSGLRALVWFFWCRFSIPLPSSSSKPPFQLVVMRSPSQQNSGSAIRQRARRQAVAAQQATSPSPSKNRRSTRTTSSKTPAAKKTRRRGPNDPAKKCKLSIAHKLKLYQVIKASLQERGTFALDQGGWVVTSRAKFCTDVLKLPMILNRNKLNNDARALFGGGTEANIKARFNAGFPFGRYVCDNFMSTFGLTTEQALKDECTGIDIDFNTLFGFPEGYVPRVACGNQAEYLDFWCLWRAKFDIDHDLFDGVGLKSYVEYGRRFLNGTLFSEVPESIAFDFPYVNTASSR